MRALIVEDETALASRLADRLQREGMVVDVATDGEEGWYFASEFTPDIAIIDLGLPKLSGKGLIERIRDSELRFPVLILTARDDWQDKVAGLTAGADDYLTKPFQMEELLARMNALIRRAAGFAKPQLQVGAITLDTASGRLTKDGAEIDLTSFEYKLLEYLMLHPGEVVSKATLTEHLYDQDFERDSNVIEVFIGRLRKKLDPDGSLKPIETLRGRGYRLNHNSTTPH